MAVSTTTNRWDYTGNAVTVDFAYNNRIFATTDLTVYLDDVLQAAGYTVSGVDAPGGGNVTFAVPPGVGVIVVIVRRVPDTQPLVFINDNAVDAVLFAAGLDRVTIQVQQIADDMARSLRMSDSDPAASFDRLPAKALLAGNLLGFDGSGDPVPLAVADLSLAIDTLLTGLTAEDFLKYDGANWINRTVAEVRTDLGGGATGIALFQNATAAAALATLGLTAGAFGKTLLAAPTVYPAGNGAAITNIVAAWANITGKAVIDIQKITATEDWTKPAFTVGVAFVRMWAPGGGGGRHFNVGMGGGGGGGQYREAWYDLADLGATETCTIGAIGAGRSTDGNGTDGGNVSFASLMTALGGKGGLGSPNPANADGGDGGGYNAGVTGTATSFVSGDRGQGGDNADGKMGRDEGGGGGGGTNKDGGNSINGGGGGSAGGLGSGGTVGTAGTSENGGDGGQSVLGDASDDATPVSGDGQFPGGGGGGHGGGGTSGDGGAGTIIVISFGV